VKFPHALWGADRNRRTVVMSPTPARLLKLAATLAAAASLAGCVVYPLRPAYYGRPAVVYDRPAPYGYYR
jgi:hypothetical protein